jgi:hypothetical protein
MSASSESPHRSPEEVRRVESQVWDFAKHLPHAAAIYAATQVGLWIALEDNAAFRSPAFGFWAESGVHLAQFFGAWAVLYGTMLRDMRVPTKTPTVLLWFSVLGCAVAWLWPGRADPSAATGLKRWLWTQLLVAIVGWVAVMIAWRRAKRAHEAGVG